jgi:hypothetical protein
MTAHTPATTMAAAASLRKGLCNGGSISRFKLALRSSWTHAAAPTLAEQRRDFQDEGARGSAKVAMSSNSAATLASG